MSLCPMCQNGLPSSCLTGLCGLSPEAPLVLPSLTSVQIEITDVSEEEDTRHSRSSSRTRKRSSGSQSAGRKEAAKLYPLEATKPCEWQGKANCGGGDYPILGCPTGVNSVQQARHHGPEKNVQNNEKGNVHRICHYCHYRWHAANDPTYNWNAGVWPPHKPRLLTAVEQAKQVIDYMRYLTSGRKKKEKVDD